MKYVRYFVLLIIIVSTIYYRNNIANYILKKTNPPKNNITIKKNEYYSNNNLKYVTITNKFIASNKQDILNIFYTILNSGEDTFEFNCDDKYKTCKEDIENIIKDNTNFSSINNLVHPYNSFDNISVDISNYGKIKVTITKIYSESQIIFINDYVSNFIKNNINDNMSDYDKIKTFHDYIINNTSFDLETADNNLRDETLSHTAYGLITNHKAICGGYSDIMSIYLYMLNIPNYRIATNKHVWNLVYINNKWLHLDLTWDDPVISDESEQLLYDYFLIDTETLLKKDTEQHNFNKEIYLEAN